MYDCGLLQSKSIPIPKNFLLEYKQIELVNFLSKC